MYKIEISDLSFSYKNSKYNSISIPKFQIKKGEKIGIIGESGSGKSTFINLLIGFLKPTSGQITVDGHNIGENMIGWSKKIGYVPQEINFLDDNIKRNIAIGIEDENIDAERLKNAIKIANLTEFISKSEKGVEQVIGNKAVKISGGQGQRIGIARAFYNKPKILILDEATNSLDEKNELDIINDILSVKEITSIIIAHRVESLKNCDKIIVFEKGKIVKQGKFEEVTQNN